MSHTHPSAPFPVKAVSDTDTPREKSDRRRLRCSIDHLTRPSGRRIGSSEVAVVVISRSRISALNPTSQSYSRTSSTDSARSERNPATARRAAARSYKRGSFSRHLSAEPIRPSADGDASATRRRTGKEGELRIAARCYGYGDPGACSVGVLQCRACCMREKTGEASRARG